jgi:hypothetical protein
VSNATKAPDRTPTNPEEVQRVLESAQNGDASTLQKMLQDPVAVDALGGDLARQVERSLIDAAAGYKGLCPDNGASRPPR